MGEVWRGLREHRCECTACGVVWVRGTAGLQGRCCHLSALLGRRCVLHWHAPLVPPGAAAGAHSHMTITQESLLHAAPLAGWHAAAWSCRDRSESSAATVVTVDYTQQQCCCCFCWVRWWCCIGARLQAALAHGERVRWCTQLCITCRGPSRWPLWPGATYCYVREAIASLQQDTHRGATVGMLLFISALLRQQCSCGMAQRSCGDNMTQCAPLSP